MKSADQQPWPALRHSNKKKGIAVDTRNSSNDEKRHHRHRPGDYTIPAGDLYTRITGFRMPTERTKRRAKGGES